MFHRVSEHGFANLLLLLLFKHMSCIQFLLALVAGTDKMLLLTLLPTTSSYPLLLHIMSCHLLSP
jgi:hypothetical protein